MNIKQLKLLIQSLPDDMPVLISDSVFSFAEPDFKTKDVEVVKDALFYELNQFEKDGDDVKIIKAFTIY